MTARKNDMAGKTKSMEGAVAAAEVDAAELAHANIRRANKQRETLDALGKLGLTTYDYGGGRVQIYFSHTGDEIFADIGRVESRGILPTLMAAIYEAGVEAGLKQERETQADALMAAVPSLADRMRKIAEEAIRDAKIEERLERDY